MNGFKSASNGTFPQPQSNTPEICASGSDFRELTNTESAMISGGNRDLVVAGAGMISASIGMAALGAVALGPIGIVFASGLAFAGGVSFGTGSWSLFQRH